MSFATTATTIVSGAIAERHNFVLLSYKFVVCNFCRFVLLFIIDFQIWLQCLLYLFSAEYCCVSEIFFEILSLQVDVTRGDRVKKVFLLFAATWYQLAGFGESMGGFIRWASWISLVSYIMAVTMRKMWSITTMMIIWLPIAQAVEVSTL